MSHLWNILPGNTRLQKVLFCIQCSLCHDNNNTNFPQGIPTNSIMQFTKRSSE